MALTENTIEILTDLDYFLSGQTTCARAMESFANTKTAGVKTFPSLVGNAEGVTR